MSVQMQAPSGFTTITLSSGNSYTANSSGQITAQNGDVSTLYSLGFVAVGGPATFSANPRNLLDGGNFSTNPFQRNIPGIASGGYLATPITNTPGYFADRWFAVGGASSSINMGVVADTSIAGFSQSLKVIRTAANTNTAAINFGQVLSTERSLAAAGQQITLSFWAKSGANYSGGSLSVSVISSTGANQSAATLAAGSWTSQASAISGSASLSAAMTKYTFTGNVGTSATQLGVLFSWTPAGTAGSDDSVSFQGLQLEIGAGSSFEFRPQAIELQLCQRFAFVLAEPASGAAITAGMNTSSAAQLFELDTSVPLFKTPTVTVSAGTFKTNQAGTATATTITAASAQTAVAIGILGNSAGTSGQATMLQGGGGSGWIVASADF